MLMVWCVVRGVRVGVWWCGILGVGGCGCVFGVGGVGACIGFGCAYNGFGGGGDGDGRTYHCNLHVDLGPLMFMISFTRLPIKAFCICI